MQIQQSFKQNVLSAIFTARENYGGSDAAYAKSLGINTSVYSRLKNGETTQLISDNELLRIGQQLQVSAKNNDWKTVRTDVYNAIESNLQFCQRHSKATILIDICGIGKSYCSRKVCSTLKNAFFLDCSQSKTKTSFTRALAKLIGADNQGRYIDVKARLKYHLNALENPIIVLDDAGYLDYAAFLDIHELWNATEGNCGWFMIGDDSLQTKIDNGIHNKRIGFSATFSRFSEDFVHLVPFGLDDKKAYLRQLIGDVANANVNDKNAVSRIITKCLKEGKTLRNVDTIIRNLKDEQNA
jgi:hypothetical protein